MHRPLGWSRQSGLIGSVVNVPVDINETMAMLPRRPDQCATLGVRLMRRMQYTHAYMHDFVRLPKVYAALEYLSRTSPLFRKNHITIDRTWWNTNGHEAQTRFEIQDIEEALEEPEASDDEMTEEQRRRAADLHLREGLRAMQETQEEEEELLAAGILQGAAAAVPGERRRRRRDDNDDDELATETLLDNDFDFAPAESK